MFHYIEPEEHYLYRDRILPFLERVADDPKLFELFEDWDQATFILAKENFQNIHGGALLVKQDRDLLHPRIREHLATLYPSQEEVWTCLISLQVDNDLTGRDFEHVCRLFYCALMADLIAFGISKGTPFLCVTMTPTEHQAIKMHEAWPYTGEVRADSSRDGLFHGVLTLLDIQQGAENARFFKKRTVTRQGDSMNS